MKYCKGCGQEKELSQFNKIRPKKNGGFTYATLCNACRYARRSSYHSEWQKRKIQKKRETVPDGRTLNVGPRPKRVFYRTCKLCGETKSVAECEGRHSICKTCFPKYRSEVNRRFRKYYQRRTREYKACKLGNGGSHTDAEWEAVKAQYNHTCLCCGRSEPEIKLTRDHVLPITKGGTDNIDNIQPLCLSCNCSKNDKSTDYR